MGGDVGRLANNYLFNIRSEIVSKNTHCVYVQGYTDRNDQFNGIGNGITAPSRLICGIYADAESAQAECERLQAHCQAKSDRDRTPCPDLSYGPYDPRDYVADENWKNIEGAVKARRELRERLYTEAWDRNRELSAK